MNLKITYSFLIVGLIPLSTADFAFAEQRPNILFIIVDDQSPYDLKVYNPKSELQTPNLDRLAGEGVVFDGAYHMGAWTGGVCTPSRHMVMSGRTVWHIPTKPGQSNNPHVGNAKLVPPDLAQYTMPAVFNRAGYDTMRTCKRGNSYEAANELFTVRHDATKRGGTDETGSAWHADRVLEYLAEREATKDVDPFLIYFGFSHPHDTRDGKPELLAKYGAVNHADQNVLPPADPKQPALPNAYLPAHPFDNTHMTVRDEVAVSGVWDKRDERTIRNELGREFACSENIDIQIGRVLAKLEDMGELDNTYIFYTADHGMAIGRHGLQGKQNLYDHTWRVPFIVKGPGVKSGTRVTGNIYLLDVRPATFPSRIPCMKNLSSIRSMLLCGVALLAAFVLNIASGMAMIRQGDWKFVYHCRADENHVPESELYNLNTDPKELRNLARDRQQQDRLAAMHTALVKELGEDPEQSEARWRAGATPEAPQGIPGNKKQTASTKGARQSQAG